VELSSLLLNGAMLSLTCWLAGLPIAWRSHARSPSYAIEVAFLASIYGLVLVTTVFAIATTSGRTLLWANLAILAALACNPISDRGEPAKTLPGVPVLLLFVLVMAGGSWWSFGGPERSHEAEPDGVYYALAARHMVEQGIENPSGPRLRLLESFRHPKPYHYLDLWTIALATQGTGQPPLPVTVFVALPYLVALASLGVFALGLGLFTQRAGPTSLLAAGLLPFASGWNFPAHIFGQTYLIGYLFPWLMFPGSLVNRPKLAVPLCLFLASYFLFRDRRWLLGLLPALLAVVHTPLLWPSGLLASALTATWLWHQGLISRRQLAAGAVLLIGLAVYLLGFYRLLAAESSPGLPPMSLLLACKGVIKALSYSLPGLAVLVLFDSAAGKPLRRLPQAWWVLLVSLWASGVLSLAIFQGELEGFQMMTEPFFGSFPALISLATAALLANLTRQRARRGVLLVAVAAALVCGWLDHVVPFYRGKPREWSADFENAVRQTVAAEAPPRPWLGQLRPPDPRDPGIGGFRANLQLETLGAPLLWWATPIDPINFSDLYFQLSEQPEARAKEERLMRGQALTSYARERHLPVDHTTVLRMIQETGLTTMLVGGADKPPEWLMPWVASTAVDARSGQILVRLKNLSGLPEPPNDKVQDRDLPTR
jgi:hypothetical protein